jgi:hypothetical protein
MKNELRLIIPFILLLILYYPLTGADPGTTDPLKGERKVDVEVAIKMTQSGKYLGVMFGISADAPDYSSTMTHWEIGKCGGNLVTIKSTWGYVKTVPYWCVDPDDPDMAVGLQATINKSCYFEIIDLKDGKIAIRSQLTGKYLSRVLYEKIEKTNVYMLVPSKDKIDATCEMQIIPIRTVTLGEPAHWYTTDIKPILILGEPPKHIDYIYNADGKKEEVNVSRTSGFYSSFKDMEKKEISSSNTHTSDSNFSVKVTAKTNADKSFPIIGGVKSDVSASAGYLYSNHKEEIEKDYKSVTTQEQLNAVNSDFLVFNKSAVHIWSYPIIGETDVKTTDGKKGQLYYQIVVPDPDTDNPYYLSGNVVEWYQPVHENGNIFSYPWSNEQVRNFEKSEKLNLLTDPKSIATDNNEMSFYVEWSAVAEKGKNVSSSHKLDTDESIGVSFLVKGVGESNTVKTHYDQTWKTLTTSNTKLTQSKGITIAKAPLPEASSYSYEVHPLIITKGTEKTKEKIEMPTGGIKLLYLVKFPEDFTSYIWWQKNYSSKPDIAINLPCQWRMTDPSGKNWKYDREFINFYLMKGLFVKDSSGKRFFYTIEEGEPVRVNFRVYNYSFCEARNVLVRLEAQKSTNGEDWEERFVVGKDTIPSLRAFGNTDYKDNWKYASVDFNTTGKAGNYYRFWAVVNPDNKIEEISDHGYKEKYSNNEGYFPIPLTVVDKHEINFKNGVERFSNDCKISASPIKFSEQNPDHGDVIDLSTWISVQGFNAFPVIVYFYENKPDQTRTLFDMEVIPFIKDGGRFFVRIPYDTFEKKGDWEITAVVLAGDAVVRASCDVRAILKVKKIEN